MTTRISLTGLAAALAAAAGLSMAGPAGAATFVVTNTSNSGAGSLRAAIDAANAASGPDTIKFAIPGAGVHTISLTSQLPAIAQPLSIAGQSQPGFAGSPLIRLDNATGNAAAVGLDVVAGGSTVRSLSISGFGTGIRLRTGDASTVAGNYVGVAGANTTGIFVKGDSSANALGGTSAADRNVISGNGGDGIQLAGPDNRVRGNFVGVTPGGLAAQANAVGIRVTSSGNTIGGTSSGARNVVSGNSTSGVLISGSGSKENVVEGNFVGLGKSGGALGNTQVGVRIENGATQNTVGGTSASTRNVISANFDGVQLDGTGTAQNVVEGNYVGTDASGKKGLGNTHHGVDVRDGAAHNTIGGTNAGARNVLSGQSGNGFGVGAYIDSGPGNTVEGNYVGTDVSGTISIANTVGVQINVNGAGNTIGGTAQGARNVVSGNGNSGIALSHGENAVFGNYVGTTAAGDGPLANAVGIVVSGNGNTIGGTSAAARNVISGNTNSGLSLAGVTATLVQGNYIGTNAAGTAAVPNGGGIDLLASSTGNTIGGTTASARNLVSGNENFGLVVYLGATANTVEGNLFGTDIAGTAPLPNGLGIEFKGGASGNTLGGTSASAANTIAFNTAQGVLVDGTDPTNGETFERNAIFSNGGLGIELANGGNHSQPAPSITSVTTGSTTTTIKLHLGSLAASTAFRVEVFSNASCDASGAGEGEHYLAAKSVTTDGSGNANVSIGVPAIGSGQQLTATATDAANGDTSEFSSCRVTP